VDTTEQRQEDCRYAVLTALNNRAAGAHTAEALRSVYLTQYDFQLIEIKDALAMLLSADLVRLIENPPPSMGRSWQITFTGSKSLIRH
jgi:hypothetical protein